MFKGISKESKVFWVGKLASKRNILLPSLGPRSNLVNKPRKLYST
jgi:hypothetical protein